MERKTQIVFEINPSVTGSDPLLNSITPHWAVKYEEQHNTQDLNRTNNINIISKTYPHFFSLAYRLLLSSCAECEHDL